MPTSEGGGVLESNIPCIIKQLNKVKSISLYKYISYDNIKQPLDRTYYHVLRHITAVERPLLSTRDLQRPIYASTVLLILARTDAHSPLFPRRSRVWLRSQNFHACLACKNPQSKTPVAESAALGPGRSTPYRLSSLSLQPHLTHYSLVLIKSFDWGFAFWTSHSRLQVVIDLFFSFLLLSYTFLSFFQRLDPFLYSVPNLATQPFNSGTFHLLQRDKRCYFVNAHPPLRAANADWLFLTSLNYFILIIPATPAGTASRHNAFIPS